MLLAGPPWEQGFPVISRFDTSGSDWFELHEPFKLSLHFCRFLRDFFHIHPHQYPGDAVTPSAQLPCKTLTNQKKPILHRHFGPRRLRPLNCSFSLPIDNSRRLALALTAVECASWFQTPMIQLTRLNSQPLIVNPDMIKFIERAPDTVLTLVTGEKLVVRESSDTVLEKIVTFRRTILAGAVVQTPDPNPQQSDAAATPDSKAGED